MAEAPLYLSDGVLSRIGLRYKPRKVRAQAVLSDLSRFQKKGSHEKPASLNHPTRNSSPLESKQQNCCPPWRAQRPRKRRRKQIQPATGLEKAFGKAPP